MAITVKQLRDLLYRFNDDVVVKVTEDNDLQEAADIFEVTYVQNYTENSHSETVLISM